MGLLAIIALGILLAQFTIRAISKKPDISKSSRQAITCHWPIVENYYVGLQL